MAPLTTEVWCFPGKYIIAPIKRQDMQKHLFQLPLCPISISRELSLRASRLPCLKQLLQSYGTQLGLEVLVAQSRQAVRAGVWWGKGPYEGLRIRGVAMGRHQFTL